MIPERQHVRIVFAAMTALTAMVSVYAWLSRTTATDWSWFYRLALPAATGALLWGGVIRPRIVGLARLFAPLSIIAVVRVADFMQDWFLTPEGIEPVDLVDRALLASYGWGMMFLFVVLVDQLERLLTARVSPEVGAVCWNAPGCPSHEPVSVDDQRYHTHSRHRA